MLELFLTGPGPGLPWLSPGTGEFMVRFFPDGVGWHTGVSEVVNEGEKKLILQQKLRDSVF